MTIQTLRFGVVPVAALLVAGCAGIPDYTTAKLVPKGGLQVMPSVTEHYMRVRGPAFDGEDGERTYSGSGGSYGASLAYGISRDWNALLRYERIGGGNDGHFVRAEGKVALDPGESALSFGYGYYGFRMHEANLTGFLNFPLGGQVYYCASPRLLMLASAEDEFVAPIVTLGNSLTFEFGGRFFVTPQAGINLGMLLIGRIGTNYGIGAGVTF
jgi:hypothetical protein